MPPRLPERQREQRMEHLDGGDEDLVRGGLWRDGRGWDEGWEEGQGWGAMRVRMRWRVGIGLAWIILSCVALFVITRLQPSTSRDFVGNELAQRYNVVRQEDCTSRIYCSPIGPLDGKYVGQAQISHVVLCDALL